jgi:dTDP-4-dehydrorhamnose 3,5-epimerase
MELFGTSHVFKEVKFFKGKFIPDDRGYFKKPFYGDNLQKNFNKINEILVSHSKKDVIRGLHFQLPPHGVEKFICCVNGKVKDVFVDLRKNSSTYGEHDSIYLDNEKNISVMIPLGFAHGFSVLSNEATVLYLQSGNFDENADTGIYSLDLGIDWEVDHGILSEKDKDLIKFQDFETPW